MERSKENARIKIRGYSRIIAMPQEYRVTIPVKNRSKCIRSDFVKIIKFIE
jgi:hypothetical protein